MISRRLTNKYLTLGYGFVVIKGKNQYLSFREIKEWYYTAPPAKFLTDPSKYLQLFYRSNFFSTKICETRVHFNIFLIACLTIINTISPKKY